MKKKLHGLKAIYTRWLEEDDLFETLGLIFQHLEHFILISGASRLGFFSSVQCMIDVVQPFSRSGLGVSHR